MRWFGKQLVYELYVAASLAARRCLAGPGAHAQCGAAHAGCVYCDIAAYAHVAEAEVQVVQAARWRPSYSHQGSSMIRSCEALLLLSLPAPLQRCVYLQLLGTRPAASGSPIHHPTIGCGSWPRHILPHSQQPSPPPPPQPASAARLPDRP
jgi:hypothetical protein